MHACRAAAALSSYKLNSSRLLSIIRPQHCSRCGQRVLDLLLACRIGYPACYFLLGLEQQQQQQQISNGKV